MFAGDVEVDEVFSNNDVGDAVTIISHLKDKGGKKNKCKFKLKNKLNIFKIYYQKVGISDMYMQNFYSLIKDVHKNRWTETHLVLHAIP